MAQTWPLSSGGSPRCCVCVFCSCALHTHMSVRLCTRWAWCVWVQLLIPDSSPRPGSLEARATFTAQEEASGAQRRLNVMGFGVRSSGQRAVQEGTPGPQSAQRLGTPHTQEGSHSKQRQDWRGLGPLSNRRPLAGKTVPSGLPGQRTRVGRASPRALSSTAWAGCGARACCFHLSGEAQKHAGRHRGGRGAISPLHGGIVAGEVQPAGSEAHISDPGDHRWGTGWSSEAHTSPTVLFLHRRLLEEPLSLHPFPNVASG